MINPIFQKIPPLPINLIPFKFNNKNVGLDRRANFVMPASLVRTSRFRANKDRCLQTKGLSWKCWGWLWAHQRFLQTPFRIKHRSIPWDNFRRIPSHLLTPYDETQVSIQRRGYSRGLCCSRWQLRQIGPSRGRQSNQNHQRFLNDYQYRAIDQRGWYRQFRTHRIRRIRIHVKSRVTEYQRHNF